MTWRNMYRYAAWCVFCLWLLFAGILGTQMGDCFDTQECVANKNHAMSVVMIGIPVVWLIGSVVLIKRWMKN